MAKTAAAPVGVELSKVMSYPAEWTAHYDDDDRAMCRRIIDWLNEGLNHAPGFANQRTQTKLATAIGSSQATVNGVLAGKYISPPKKHLQAMLAYIDREQERADGVTVPQVQTSVVELVDFICSRAHKYRDVGIVSGVVGVGKTESLKLHARKNTNAILVEGMTDMNALVFLRHMVEVSGATIHKSHQWSRGTKADMVDGVIRALKGSDKLLILDEADKVTPQTLEFARRISDLAGIGLVLAGTETLRPMVEDPSGRHGQISSRVGFWPPIIKSIKKEDATLITLAAFGERDRPADAVLDAFWQMCDGRARVLVKLIRNVIELCLDKGHALTPDLVFAAGQQLMGLRRPKGVM